MPDQATTKTVWLLGAGASKSASRDEFPVLLDVPATANRIGVHIDRASGGRSPYDHLKAYVRDKFDLDLTLGPRVDLEAVLTMLDIDRELETRTSAGAARAQLIRYLQDTFRRLHATNQDLSTEYASLAERLGGYDTVITFNWDLLLDEALERTAVLNDPALARQRTQYFSFVHDFTAIGESTFNKLSLLKPVRQWGSKHGYYLKLHGSIDWVWCGRSTCRNAGRLFPLSKYTTRPSCGYCLEKMQWLIVPPTLNKRLLETPVVRRLWNVAARELAQANALVIWGYSLPPTDFFSSWLLRTVSAKRLSEFILINPAAVTGPTKKTPKLGTSFLGRFDHLIRSALTNGTVKVFWSFQDYLSGRDLRQRFPSLAAKLDEYLDRRTNRRAPTPVSAS